MNNQKELLKYVAENYTKDQQKEMQIYCEANFFKFTCEDCKFQSDCKKINSNYVHSVVNGKKIGYFYLQDLGV